MLNITSMVQSGIFICNETTLSGVGVTQNSEQATAWASGNRFPVEAGIFSLRHSVQNGSGTQQTFYPTGMNDTSRRSKAAGD